MIILKDNIELLHEVSLHEASHVVTYFFLKALDARLSTITSVVACLDADVSKVSYTSPVYPQEAFFNDKEKLRMKMINLLAGYCSYYIFIEETDSFLSYVVEIGEDKTSVAYHDIDDIINTPELINQYSDISKVRKLLIGFCKNGKGLSDNLKYFIRETLDFLQDKKVKSAISFVADELVNNQCAKIEGKELNNVLQKVNTILYE